MSILQGESLWCAVSCFKNGNYNKNCKQSVDSKGPEVICRTLNFPLQSLVTIKKYDAGMFVSIGLRLLLSVFTGKMWVDLPNSSQSDRLLSSAYSNSSWHKSTLSVPRAMPQTKSGSLTSKIWNVRVVASFCFWRWQEIDVIGSKDALLGYSGEHNFLLATRR